MKTKFKKSIFFYFSYAGSSLNIIAKKLFKRASLLILVLGIFLLPKISTAVNITSENIIALTNNEREAEGLGALSANQMLAKAAYNKGTAILENQVFGHTIDGKKFSTWISDAGYFYSYAGENLAINFITAEGVVKAWKKSPTHYKNILNPLFKEIGVAVVSGEFNDNNTIIVVQAFGAPPVLSTAPVVSGQIEPSSRYVPSGDLSVLNSYPQSLSRLYSLAHTALNYSDVNDRQEKKLAYSNLKPLSVLAANAAGNYSVGDIDSLGNEQSEKNILSYLLPLFLLVMVLLSILTVTWLYINSLFTLLKLRANLEDGIN